MHCNSDIYTDLFLELKKITPLFSNLIGMNTIEQFIREVNEAISDVNTDYLLDKITDDFCWTIIGEKTVSGKTEFSEAMDQMRGLPKMKISIEKVMTDQQCATVEGVVVGKNRNGQKKYFAFADIYELEGANDPKIKKLTSYVIDVSKHKQYKESF